MRNTIYIGSAMKFLMRIPDNSVHCIVTSPPYFGLRDYGVDGQLGLEGSPEAYIERLVAIFREARRVLRDDGTCWLNLGDSYFSNNSYVSSGSSPKSTLNNFHAGTKQAIMHRQTRANGQRASAYDTSEQNYKPKDLMMMPARVAIALQADGWWLRSDIIWHKPNPMPESVTDRPTNAHEHVFLLTKSAKYFYDAEAIREPSIHAGKIVLLGEKSLSKGQANGRGVAPHGNALADSVTVTEFRNKRNVWTINTKGFSEAHFAVMPTELAETCIKAGCPQGGVVLDMFGGAGTTAVAAVNLGCDYLLGELSAEYVGIAQKRIKATRQALQNADPLQATVFENGDKQLSLFSGGV